MADSAEKKFGVAITPVDERKDKIERGLMQLANRTFPRIPTNDARREEAEELLAGLRTNPITVEMHKNMAYTSGQVKIAPGYLALRAFNELTNFDTVYVLRVEDDTFTAKQITADKSEYKIGADFNLIEAAGLPAEVISGNHALVTRAMDVANDLYRFDDIVPKH